MTNNPTTPVVPVEPANEFLWYVSGSSICEPAGTIAENLPKEVAELIVRTHNQEIEAFCCATTPSPVRAIQHGDKRSATLKGKSRNLSTEE